MTRSATHESWGSNRLRPEGQEQARPYVRDALAGWLVEIGPELHAAWMTEIRTRDAAPAPEAGGLIERFTARLVRMLPHVVGPRRELVRPLWERACELFGTTAAKRGMAAGEVGEEIHLLRALLLRRLHQDGAPTLTMPQTMRLHGALDRGATLATVGHTDALFFQYLERGGTTGDDLDEFTAAMGTELETLDGELLGLVRPGAEGPAPSPSESSADEL